jgi:hypothetical protein
MLPVYIGLRLGKHVFDETDTTIQSYNDVLDSLMQQFRDLAARDTVVIARHMGKTRVLGLFELFLTFHDLWHR